MEQPKAQSQPCRFEKELFQMAQDIAEIKAVQGSQMREITKHIEQGDKWRVAVLGVVMTIVLQLFGFSYWYGTLNNRVSHIEHEVAEHKNVD